ncbi:MAG: hypothetical protein ABFR63_11250 [Thermodesulfobacteriota bacterium]
MDVTSKKLRKRRASFWQECIKTVLEIGPFRYHHCKSRLLLLNLSWALEDIHKLLNHLNLKTILSFRGPPEGETEENRVAGTTPVLC